MPRWNRLQWTILGWTVTSVALCAAVELFDLQYDQRGWLSPVWWLNLLFMSPAIPVQAALGSIGLQGSMLPGILITSGLLWLAAHLWRARADGE
jgi:hypothetical protein